MKFIVFWDYDSRYILNDLGRAVTHSVLNNVVIADHHMTRLKELILQIHNIDEADALVVSAGRTSHTEKILSTLRFLKITKPIYVVKGSTKLKRMSIIDLNGGGGEIRRDFFGQSLLSGKRSF